MQKLKQGSVTVHIPDDIEIPEKAGKLTADEVARLEKPRRGVGLTCDKTAKTLAKNPERITVPGVVPAELAKAGEAAEDIDTVISDLEHVLLKLKQANALLDSHAHRELRKVLAVVRSQEKFDPNLADLFEPLVTYFATTRAAPPEEEPKPE